MTLTEETLDDMVEVIVQVTDPEAVIVFGSRARGDETEAEEILR